MASFNKVVLMGHLTAAPELRQTQSGQSVTSFSIGVNRRFAQDGARNVDFINVVAWRDTAEFISRYFVKGDPILVCGQLQTRTWNDNRGEKRYATEVVADEAYFVQNKAQREDQQPAPYTPPAYSTPSFSNMATQFEEIPNDGDLPF